MCTNQNRINNQTLEQGAAVSTAVSLERQLHAPGDVTAAPVTPGGVIPGESFQNEETPGGGERYDLVSIGGRGRIIAHPQPLPESPAEGAITDFLNCTFPFLISPQPQPV